MLSNDPQPPACPRVLPHRRWAVDADQTNLRKHSHEAGLSLQTRGNCKQVNGFEANMPKVRFSLLRGSIVSSPISYSFVRMTWICTAQLDIMLLKNIEYVPAKQQILARATWPKGNGDESWCTDYVRHETRTLNHSTKPAEHWIYSCRNRPGCNEKLLDMASAGLPLIDPQTKVWVCTLKTYLKTLISIHYWWPINNHCCEQQSQG